MFTATELFVIRKALEMSFKSAERLARREGQPDSVVKAYQESKNSILALIGKVDGEVAKVRK